MSSHSDLVSLFALSTLTYRIEHNPHCPSPYLVRLVGEAGKIDGLPTSQTKDSFGYGKTLTDATHKALHEEFRTSPTVVLDSREGVGTLVEKEGEHTFDSNDPAIKTTVHDMGTVYGAGDLIPPLPKLKKNATSGDGPNPQNVYKTHAPRGFNPDGPEIEGTVLVSKMLPHPKDILTATALIKDNTSLAYNDGKGNPSKIVTLIAVALSETRDSMIH